MNFASSKRPEKAGPAGSPRGGPWPAGGCAWRYRRSEWNLCHGPCHCSVRTGCPAPMGDGASASRVRWQPPAPPSAFDGSLRLSVAPCRSRCLHPGRPGRSGAGASTATAPGQDRMHRASSPLAAPAMAWRRRKQRMQQRGTDQEHAQYLGQAGFEMLGMGRAHRVRAQTAPRVAVEKPAAPKPGAQRVAQVAEDLQVLAAEPGPVLRGRLTSGLAWRRRRARACAIPRRPYRCAGHVRTLRALDPIGEDAWPAPISRARVRVPRAGRATRRARQAAGRAHPAAP